MYTNVEIDTNDLSLVKEKMKAYKILFDIEPVLWIGGYWEDKQRNSVHFWTSGKAISVGRKYVLAEVDGYPLYIKPDKAWFSIGWK